MKNPYKFLREQAGYTQKKFCDEFDFAKQTLLSIEQGVYEEISVRMHAAIVNACLFANVNMGDLLIEEYGNDSLLDAYKRWRETERANCDQRIVGYVPWAGTATESPAAFFVKETVGSMQGFAKQLKVQTAILLAYVTGKQKDMPYPLREALADAGYPYIDVLEKMQNDWNKNRAE